MIPQHIDSTMLNTFRSCHMKYLREYGQGLRPPGISIDLHAGACFASALEEVRKQIYGRGKTLGDALVLAQARFFVEWGDVEPPEWKRTAKTKDRVWEAVEAYFQHFSPLTDHIQPYKKPDGSPTLEYTFAIPLTDEGFPLHPDGGPFLYAGRFDMIGQYQSNPCIVDEKTTGSSIGQKWAYQWDLRSQFLGYLWACRINGINVSTVVIRGIAIQKEQIVFAEAIKLYSDYLIDKWFEQLRRDLWKLVDCHNNNYFDYNLGETCTSYGLCPYMASCASPNPEAWLSEFEIRHWNPTEKNPVETPLQYERTY